MLTCGILSSREVGVCVHSRLRNVLCQASLSSESWPSAPRRRDLAPCMSTHTNGMSAEVREVRGSPPQSAAVCGSPRQSTTIHGMAVHGSQAH